MYSSIRIKGFKSFKKLELPDLKPINIIIGQNGSGKTNILQAIHTLSRYASNDYSFEFDPINSDKKTYENIKSTFYDTHSLPYEFNLESESKDHENLKLKVNLAAILNPSANASSMADLILIGIMKSCHDQNEMFPNDRFIGLCTTSINGKSKRTDIDFSIRNSDIMHGALRHCMINEVYTYTALQQANLIDNVTSKLTETFPEIVELGIKNQTAYTSYVFAKTRNDRELPFWTLGDGTQKWFYLIGQMAANKNTCHCIDNLADGMHPDIMSTMSPLLVDYAMKFNNQLFITSHSIDLLYAFLASIYDEGGIHNKNNVDPVRVFFLKPHDDGQVEAWPLSGRETLEKHRKETP